MLKLNKILTEREPTEDELTAYHEATHFVMGLLAKGGLPRRLTIESDANHMGYCGGSPTSAENERQRHALGLPIDTNFMLYSSVIAMTGCVFEDAYGEERHASGDSAEIEEMLGMAYGWVGYEMWDALYSFTAGIMKYAAFHRACDVVAEQLLTFRDLNDDQIGAAYDDAHTALGKWHGKLRDKVATFVDDTVPALATAMCPA